MGNKDRLRQTVGQTEVGMEGGGGKQRQRDREAHIQSETDREGETEKQRQKGIVRQTETEGQR